ncbi:uncharacterized protein [Halyomorpha halys]|uniref:uncharacterized protein n=1 Tax=Halyomorpha halys TaxID=286706 RepID=UPI0006D4C744|nr:uncharacterized protein LOC106681230 [Halyomorpha halys]
MEAEEQKHDPEEEVKKPKFVKLTIEKIKEISDRMLQPSVEEEKARDIKRIIRAIKDPDAFSKAMKLKPKMIALEEEASAQVQKKSPLEKNKESLHSLYKLPGTDIKLGSVTAESIGFIECMSGPRFPHFDETESDTTFERLSNDSESVETPSLLALLNSDLDETEQPEEKRKVCKTVAELTDKEYEKEDDKKTVSKKPKLKRWKPRVKKTGMTPDPMIIEYADEVLKYLSEIGIFCFMKEWLQHIYGMKPKPKDPVKLLREYLERSLGDSEKETGASQLEEELRKTLKKEDDITVETSKLIHLAHLLAPQIYDAQGNMISYEPSVEEEQLVMEEEDILTQSAENIEDVPTIAKGSRKSSVKARQAKKVKNKQSVPDLTGVPSKVTKASTKLKKKKSVGNVRSIRSLKGKGNLNDRKEEQDSSTGV